MNTITNLRNAVCCCCCFGFHKSMDYYYTANEHSLAPIKKHPTKWRNIMAKWKSFHPFHPKFNILLGALPYKWKFALEQRETVKARVLKINSGFHIVISLERNKRWLGQCKQWVYGNSRIAVMKYFRCWFHFCCMVKYVLHYYILEQEHDIACFCLQITLSCG